MSRCLAILALVFALTTVDHTLVAQIKAQRSFPFTAIVLNDGAAVHCGPGGKSSFYATHSMKQGDVVEVWRLDPGGWCAIRPPTQSFSLVPESAVKLLVEDIGEIQSPVPAYVGTKLGPVEKPQWQVRLNPGERVSIIGEVSWPNPSGAANIWYQIEPPQGEFRWIRMSELQLPPEGRIAPPKLGQQIAKGLETEIAKQLPAATQTVSDSGWKRATRPLPRSGTGVVAMNAAPSTFTSSKTTSVDDLPVERFPGGFAEPEFPVPSAAPPAIERPQRFASLESMSDQVRSFAYFDEKQRTTPVPRYDGQVGSGILAIEEQLSAELLKEPATWRLEPIATAANQLYQSSSDPVERLAIQRIFTKLEKCRGVCAGYRQSATSRISSGLGQGRVGQGRVGVSPSSSYDVTGWLKRLANSQGSELDPTYVLQDGTGKVTHHIAGGAGLNLNRYLDQPVGVIGGRRGFHRGLKLPHITADRIVVLQR